MTDPDADTPTKRETGRERRQARRNIRRKEARQHGEAVPPPAQTTVMRIPDHILALAAQVKAQKAKRS